MPTDAAGNDPITVVGIGASAGGLGALRELIGDLPAQTGLAFVIVVHLAPDHESHLADLLQPGAAIPVLQVTDDVSLRPDHIYVIPPNRNLSAIDTHLRLSPLDGGAARRHPIDYFFRTLAEVHDGHSIGVVLSGTGSDGTAGLSTIRANGGLTMAQDPVEAEYDGMPRSAILAETVDLVLPLSDIAQRIVELGNERTDLLSELVADEPDDDTLSALGDVLAIISERTGHDLSGYKESTIRRRMQRRVQLHRMGSLAAYLDLLERSTGEAELLFNDLLIPVTNFFRDAEVFDVLQAEVVPGLFEGKGRGDSVRVWSAGCSTGEEPYSLAILLLEYAATLPERPQIQVFASDLHEASLQRARLGAYPAAIETDITPARLRRWFVATDTGYAIDREVRDAVVFAHHDLLADPPFSHIDLISCRNLLIYLQREVQRDAIRAFHYALNPGGVLFLGTSETIDRTDLFTGIDEHRGIFRRRDAAVREPPLPSFRTSPRRAAIDVDRPVTRPQHSYEQLHRSLLERYGPPSVLVDGGNRVVRFSADVGRYLTHPDGAPTNDLFLLVDERLRLELRSAVFAARHDGKMAVSRPMRAGDDASDRTVRARVVPVEDDDLLLVLFEDTVSPASFVSSVDGIDVEGAVELDDANRRLESVIEQYESGQEEMRAANEELQSTNEELRSTMEELETSKEELQSTNEELSTLNQENRYKVEELAMLSSDLQNLLVATDIATLFLDRQLRIVRFTPPVARIFNVVLDDRGRPLADFTNRLQGHDMSADALEVLERLVPIEYELRSDDGRWLLTRIIPYRTSDDRIEGVVVTFVDITRRYEAEAALRASEHGLRLALDAAAMGTWSWDPTDESSSGDDRAFEIVGASAADGAFADVVADRLLETDRERWWAFVRSGDDGDLEFRASTVAGDIVDVQVNVRDDASEPAGSVTPTVQRTGTIRDVTSRVRAMESLADRTKRLTLLAQAAAHLLRGSEPETVLHELFDEMAVTLGLEIYEQFEYGEDASPCSVGGNVTWATPEPGETGGADVGPGTCSLAFERREPVIYDGIVHFPDGSRAAADREGLQAYGCFPLVASGKVFGALCFGTRGESRFDDATVELIRTIVDYLAVGEQRLRTEAELRELNRSLESRVDEATRDLRVSEEQLRHLASDLVRAEQSERQRIAELLHDDLQQLLFGAQMRVGLLRDDLGGSDERVVAHLDEAERYLGESIAIARHLTAELVPPALDDDDLGETVRWLVDQMRELHDLDVELHMRTDIHLPDRETRVVVHQTIRELLFNVVKHAGVGHARIELAVHDDEVEIHVEDGGSGFDTDEVFADPTREGRGLATLRQRLSLVGGGLTLESIPGAGTSAHVRLPIITAERRD